MQRDIDFDNLQPGDKVTIVWTVCDDGFNAVSGSSSRLNLDFARGLWKTRRDAFVSHRAPQPLKPGDRFGWSKSDLSPCVKILVWMDDKTIVYDMTPPSGNTYRQTYSRSPNGQQPVHYVE